VAHRFQDGLRALLQNLGGNAGLVAGLAQDRRIGASVQQDAGQRDLESRYPLNAGGEGVEMDAVAAAQQRAVDIEQIGVLRVPGKARLNGDARFVGRWSCQHVLEPNRQPWR